MTHDSSFALALQFRMDFWNRDGLWPQCPILPGQVPPFSEHHDLSDLHGPSKIRLRLNICKPDYCNFVEILKNIENIY